MKMVRLMKVLRPVRGYELVTSLTLYYRLYYEAGAVDEGAATGTRLRTYRNEPSRGVGS